MFYTSQVLNTHLFNSFKTCIKHSFFKICFLGCKTVSVGLTSNLKEWLPPGALGVFSDRMPLGYRALKVYSADLVLDGWPSAEQVFSQCLPFILDRA